MDPLAAHRARVGHIRETFAEANERLVARLRGADDEEARRVPDGGGWSTAQIAWHVAKVSTRFAGIMSGELPGAQPVAADFEERPWPAIVAEIGARLEAPIGMHPPPGVTRMEAIAALEASGMKMARALDAVTPERGARLCISSAIVGGAINLYQVGEWATAHIIRHNKQAKQTLGK